MAEHLLDGAQVGATFEQMGGERVAQGVRRYVFAYACKFGVAFDDVEYHHAGKAASAAVEKHYVLRAQRDIQCIALREIFADAPYAFGREGHHALFGSFA